MQKRDRQTEADPTQKVRVMRRAWHVGVGHLQRRRLDASAVDHVADAAADGERHEDVARRLAEDAAW